MREDQWVPMRNYYIKDENTPVYDNGELDFIIPTK